MLDENSKKNSGELGFLQKFYAINLIKKFVSCDELLKDAFGRLEYLYYNELYNSDYGKRYINESYSIDDANLKLLSTIFPDFLNDSFDFNSISDEVKSSVNMIFKHSETYKNSSDTFKSRFKHVMERVNEGKNYTEAKIIYSFEDLSDGCVIEFNKKNVLSKKG